MKTATLLAALVGATAVQSQPASFDFGSALQSLLDHLGFADPNLPVFVPSVNKASNADALPQFVAVNPVDALPQFVPVATTAVLEVPPKFTTVEIANVSIAPSPSAKEIPSPSTVPPPPPAETTAAVITTAPPPAPPV
ncbi:hypothetical protein HDU98_004024, partial [Podochytrium sp. JEL0797]